LIDFLGLVIGFDYILERELVKVVQGKLGVPRKQLF